MNIIEATREVIQGGGNEDGLWSQAYQVLILVLPLTTCDLQHIDLSPLCL